MKRPFRKRRWDRLAFAALLLMIAATALKRQSAYDPVAAWLPPGDYRVQKVVDARQLVLSNCTQPELRAPIQLLGIAMPDPWPDRLRTEAIQRIAQVAGHRTVTLRLDRRRITPDGRLLGYVFVDEHLLNADLVERGLAVSATRPEDCHALVRQIKEAELVARTAERGIWARASAKPKPEA